MIKPEANKRLNIGYSLLIAGFLIGLSIETQPNFSEVGQGIMIGYILWSTYFGIMIVARPILNYFDFKGVTIPVNSVFKLFSTHSKIKWCMRIIILIVGYLVGVLGGAIYKQIQLSKIAYS